MQRIFLVSTFITLLLLGWTALDDITTGNEPSLIGEYSTVIVSLPIFALIGYHLLRKIKP
ncbi:MAG: hypothetical protein Q8P25_01120 [Candidatus Curtissbacteria bacterium]|nr:hypothetical protein [Candidatus Curtissbacteria bacterium]